MLKTMTEEEEYVVALFLNNCDKNAEQCEATIDELENIAAQKSDFHSPETTSCGFEKNKNCSSFWARVDLYLNFLF